MLDGHFHVDLSMRLVPFHLEVVDGEVLDILHLTLDSKLWKWQRLSSQLRGMEDELGFLNKNH